MSEQKPNSTNKTTSESASSSNASSEGKKVHPQAWLQAMYSAGRGGLARGGGGRGGGHSYRGNGRGGHYRGNNHHHHGGGRGGHYKPRDNYRKRDASEVVAEDDSEENKSKEPKIENEVATASSSSSENNEHDSQDGNKGDLNEENIPEYIKFLQDYKKNYKNPIFSMLYKKPMETPEDIEKYREERRKNFPTKKHIIEKEKVLAERRQKGEIIVGASEKVKSLLKVMGIEKDKRDDNDEEGEEMRSKSLIKNLLTQEISQDKMILLQCFRHIIFENFFCEESEMSSEVKEKLTKIKELTKAEMKKLEEYRKKKLGLVDEELISPSEKTSDLKEFSSDDEFGEMSDNENNDDEDDLLGDASSETQQIDKILKEIDQ
ncbi:predicted protein [Naegleria gruberi]|uniref:Predicted protein n=1 Tax=Naegleria gruberi TaxID=5762 RepID=D2V4T0_NAEGR|nr:uncharacterized protein NAEGRDRAFT_63896 [Naegleria gruberi]EFC48153.1 predicted protein [Naegleria gruberi]|eukprot:XP_002680897.1 predicted protein [Naegleria gruberi strain NEG-M]